MQIQQIRLLGRDALTGIADPGQEILETDLLLSHGSGLTRTQILANPDGSLEPEITKTVLSLIDRRKLHEPIAYITGVKEFFGFSFEVTPDVLVPRPETELLVELMLERVMPLIEENQPFTVIDVGTGSGAIILSLVRTLSERFGEPALKPHKFVGVDRSQEALAVAIRNAESWDLLPNVLFGPSDLLSAFQGKLDAFPRPIFTVANLPYIPLGEELPPTVGEFEPEMALRGGRDGLDLVRRCIQEWESLAISGELLLLETGAGQPATLLSEPSPGYSMKTYQDLRGIDRVVELVKRGKEDEERQ